MTAKTMSQLEQAKAIILWAREQKVALSLVTIGDVTLHFADLELGGRLVPRKPTDEEQIKSMYEQYGGTALEQAVADTQHTTEEHEEAQGDD